MTDIVSKKFLKEINYISNHILNSVVVYIDLIEGLTDDEIYDKTQKYLGNEKNIKLYVKGSDNDSLTSIQAIMEEKSFVSTYGVDKNYNFLQK